MTRDMPKLPKAGTIIAPTQQTGTKVAREGMTIFRTLESGTRSKALL